MANKKWLFVIWSAILVILLAGCGIGANSNKSSDDEKDPVQEEVKATFETSVSTKEQNNTAIIGYKAKNISGKTQNLTFPNGLKVDYIVYDEQGKKVKQYSDEVMATQAIVNLALENNQVIAQEFTISDLPKGKYKIEIFLTAKEEKAKGMIDLLIEGTKQLKGTGVLVGQVDPHSVEITVDGKATAFQLSQQAQQQLPLVKDGDTVSFTYTTKIIEEGLEQKTIEKFDLNSGNPSRLTGTGVLVGQMDPHSVEITVEGKATAFQLSEEAQQQLPLVKDGDTVTFNYTTKVIEGDLEQKTIEEFELGTK